MKLLTKAFAYKTFITLLILNFFQVVALAQDSESPVSITAERHMWYTQPWALITGIALVLIVIVALVPSNSPDNNNNTDKITF
jgi:hypothetical protein